MSHWSWSILRRAAGVAALSFALAISAAPSAEAKGHGHGAKKMKIKGGKRGHHHHHHHGKCGHARKYHNGAWVYQVDGAWYGPGAGGWIVVPF